MYTFGKLRHLAQSSTANGHFVILAIDHRENLRTALTDATGVAASDDDIRAFKRDVLSSVSGTLSAVLTDPAFGFGAGIAEGYLDGHIGLLSPLEVTDYGIHPSRRDLEMLPGWSVAKLKRVGAAGVKLLVFYNPADTLKARAVQGQVEQVVEQCQRYDVPLYLEPIVYSMDENTPLTSSERRALVIETARGLSILGIDILKIEFPLDVKAEPDESAWMDALYTLDGVSAVPWVLLTGGVDYETFKRQTRAACQAGASGVIAGRGIWKEALALGGEERLAFLETTARGRLAELAQIIAEHGTNWRDRGMTPPAAPSDWYETYAEFD